MKEKRNSHLDSEILAAISAVISSLEVRNGHKLVVRSMKKISHTSPVWNMTGRMERLDRRMS